MIGSGLSSEYTKPVTKQFTIKSNLHRAFTCIVYILLSVPQAPILESRSEAYLYWQQVQKKFSVDYQDCSSCRKPKNCSGREELFVFKGEDLDDRAFDTDDRQIHFAPGRARNQVAC